MIKTRSPLFAPNLNLLKQLNRILITSKLLKFFTSFEDFKTIRTRIIVTVNNLVCKNLFVIITSDESIKFFTIKKVNQRLLPLNFKLRIFIFTVVRKGRDCHRFAILTINSINLWAESRLPVSNDIIIFGRKNARFTGYTVLLL